MSDALSIFAAAREAGPATALRIGAQQFSFAELAEMVRERLAGLDSGQTRLHPLLGSNTLETLVTLYALLEARAAALLLDPRHTDCERQAALAAAGRAGWVCPPDTAVVIHTSGTTGDARAVVLTRTALLASARASAANLGWQDDDCWLITMPLARVGGLSIVTRCLAARRAIALAPAFDARLLPQWLVQQRATLVSLVPTMLVKCLAENPAWQPPAFLRAVLLGGAASSPALLGQAADRGLPIVITYGCTETGSQVVATPYAMRYRAAECGAGLPLAGVEMRISDQRIEVRGPMLMTGYLGQAARDPADWFDTGDLGQIDQRGYLHMQARRADLIVSGGENVYPAEVERVLESCPGIVAAGVFGVADETWGQTVAAALVVGAQAPSDPALLDHLGASLAPYKRPRGVCFVAALPQTGAGKLDRLALAALSGALRPLRAANVGPA